jgi:thioredoxin 1
VAPLVEQLAGEYDGRAKVGKLDVDAARQIASNYNISSIPTIIVFKGGEVVDQVMGARPKAALAQLIDRNL